MRHTRTLTIIALLALTLLVAACGGSAPSTSGTTPSTDSAAVKSAQDDDTSCSRTPVPGDALAAAMPMAVGEMTTDEKPFGVETPMPDGSLFSSSLQTILGAPNGDFVTVEMADNCLATHQKKLWNMLGSRPGGTAYTKTTVGGQPAWEGYDKNHNAYSYAVLVEDHVLVTADGSSDVPKATVQAVAEAVDYAKIKSALT